jgi:hypothetical protein
MVERRRKVQKVAILKVIAAEWIVAERGMKGEEDTCRFITSSETPGLDKEFLYSGIALK